MTASYRYTERLNTVFTPNKRQAGQGVERRLRKFQILTVLDDHLRETESGTQYERGMTARQIAKRIGMSSSPHLRNLLDALYLEGAVLMHEYPYRPNCPQYRYTLDPAAFYKAHYRDLWVEKDTDSTNDQDGA